MQRYRDDWRRARYDRAPVRAVAAAPRDILRAALFTQRSRARTLVEAVRARIEPLGGAELDIGPREPMRGPVTLE